MASEPRQEKYSPLALIAVVLASLLLFCVFFIGFLVAPLAILLIFYVVFAASDRSKRNAAQPAPHEYDDDGRLHMRDDAPGAAAGDTIPAEDRLAQDAARRRAGTSG